MLLRSTRARFHAIAISTKPHQFDPMLSDSPQHLSSFPPATAAGADEPCRRAVPPTVASGLWRIGAFTVAVALLAFGLDRFVDAGLQRVASGEFGVWNRIVRGDIDADIVISGSSRALSHYDPRVLQQITGRSAFNIGLNGSQTDMQLARLKTYLRHNRKPMLLIHNLDAFSFQVTHKEVYDPGQYMPYLDQADLYEALLRVDPGTWKWRYLPLHGYATQDLRLSWLTGLRDWIKPADMDNHVAGYKPRNLRWTEDFERFRAGRPQGIRVTIEPEGVQQMEELLRLCAQQKIPVILSYSPEYLPMQAMTLNRGEIFDRFAALALKHGALLLDFSGSPISQHQDNFYNSQHLNADGASAFSRELASRLPNMAMVRR